MEMDKVKLGLLGAILVISAYGVYQVSSLKSEVSMLKEDMIANVNSIKSMQSAAQGSTISTNITNNDVNALPENNSKPVGPTTSIKFAEEIHHFGTVEVESENLYAFKFTNTGSEPLIISSAKGSCGCTVPNWPSEPILPGQTGVIDVKFTPNTGQAGQAVEKVVTVTANTNPENTMVRIQADVIAK